MDVFAGLVGWTVLAASWWVVAGLVVGAERGRGARFRRSDAPADPRRLTVFKPLPPLARGELQRLAPALESWVVAADSATEVLVGVHEKDRPALDAWLAGVRETHPTVDLKRVARERAPDVGNPKVAWMRELTRHASGKLWLWSDADITAPPDAVRTLRRELVRSRGKPVTVPYVVARADVPAEILDTMFVNVELSPGALLLGRLGPVPFAFGAGFLHAADHFAAEADWDALEGCLAEDHELGRTLGPCRLAAMRLETRPTSEGALPALSHYLRWQKTIRWVRPLPFAAQLGVIPLVGWIAAFGATGGDPRFAVGAAGTVALEAIAAAILCRLHRCRLAPRAALALPAWSLVRAATWLAVWFPWPVRWRGRSWWSPRVAVGSRI